MAKEEMKNLFKRFSQANSRTHIEYGGSGIGLYICHKLVEKQDGGIGVASSPGEGSVFGFYIETRRVKGPSSGSTPQANLSQLARRSSDRSGLPTHVLSSELASTVPAALEEEPARPALTRLRTDPGLDRFSLLLVEDVSQIRQRRVFAHN